MNNPQLYGEANAIARWLAKENFDEFAPKFKWLKSEERVIDVGCADGSVTCILKKYVPSNYVKFVACDISQKMVDYAKEHHKDENITFRVLDIQKDIPDDLKCGFDHVISSMVFHLVQKQEEGFKGIYDLMRPGGECFLTFFAYQPLISAFDAVAKNPNLKWGKFWLKDVGRIVSVYCHMKDPVKYVTEILNKIGFINVDVQCRKKRYVFQNIGAIKAIIRATDVFGMPDDVFEEFFKDYMGVVKSMGLLPRNLTDLSDVTTEIPCDFEIIIVHANKPM